MTQLSHLFRQSMLALAGAAVCAGAAMAAGAGVESEAQARYRQDMARCNSGQSNQDRTTCRLEARNALTEARRGGLTNPGGQAAANATQRCSAFPVGDDRSACEARVRGEGATAGSVAGGGILRETITVVPAK